MNDGAYIASPQETICVTEQECGEVVHVVPADETAGTAVSLRESRRTRRFIREVLSSIKAKRDFSL